MMRIKRNTINRAAKNLKVGAGDQHLKDNAIDAINDGINNAATGAESYEMLGSTIDNLATGFATNQGLQVANESYNNRQTELALQAEMRAKGMQVLDFGAVYDETGQVVGHSFDNHNSYWTDDDGTVHTNVYQAGSEHQLDYGMKMKQLIGTIAKDGTQLKRLNGELAGFMEYGTGVSQRKVNRVATQLFDTYMETDEGMQQMRKLTQIDGLSLEEAQGEIISEMIAVAQPQVGWIPQYMKDPQYVAGGGSSVGAGNAMTVTGEVFGKNDGSTPFRNIQGSIADLMRLHRTSEGDEKIQYGHELNKAINQMNAMSLKIALTGPENIQNAAKTKAGLFAGDNNRFAILDSLLDATTTGSWWDASSGIVARVGVPWSDGAAGEYKEEDSNYFPYFNASLAHRNDWTPWDNSREFVNVSQAGLLESQERDWLKGQFSDPEALNDIFGTNYTEADIPALQQLADDYYTFMHEQKGDELRTYVADNVEIKQDDRVVFAPEGSTELNAVNKSLSQLRGQDFIIFGVENEELTAEAIETIQNDIEKAKANETLKFEGMTMPNMWSGTQPSLYLNVNGTRVRAVPRASSNVYGPKVMQSIANNLGLGQLYSQNNQIVDETLAGNRSNAEAMSAYMTLGRIDQLASIDGFTEAYNNNTLTEWATTNNLDANAVLESGNMLRNLDRTMLREINIMSGGAFTENQLRGLNSDPQVGKPEDIALFNKTKNQWLGSAYSFR